MSQDENKGNNKHLRGFASMTPERRREIARKGGLAAQEKGVAHRFTSEEARAAGKKGGEAFKKLGREHAAEIGRMGGKARAAAARERAKTESQIIPPSTQTEDD